MRRYYRVKCLPNFDLPKYANEGLGTMEAFLKLNEEFLRELHSLGIVYHSKVSFHLLYLFKPELEIYFYINGDGDEVDNVNQFFKHTALFSLFYLEECGNLDVLYTDNYIDASFLQKRNLELKVRNLQAYEVRNNAEGPKIATPISWEIDTEAKWNPVLKQINEWKRNVTVRLDLFPGWCYSQWINDSSDIRTDLKKRSSFGGMTDDGCISIIQRNIQNFTDILASTQCFYANIVVLTDQEGLSTLLCNRIGANFCKNTAFKTIHLKENTIMNCQFGDTGIFSNVFSDNSDMFLAHYKSVFSVDELCNLYSFPYCRTQDTIGYTKEDAAPSVDETTCIHIGETEDKKVFSVPLDNLTRHCFISGMTGSGKTRCMFQIINQLNEKGIPFLVFEPIKQEYRELILKMKNVLFLAPGVNTNFSLHINIFEFPKNVTLNTHIDNLIRIFRGAFYIPTPGPSLLEKAILHAYNARGWFANMVNTEENWKKWNLSYPDIDDLILWVQCEIDKTDYRSEFRNDMKAILSNRIDSFKNRSLGDIYDCRRSTIRPEEWIDKSIILEMNALSESDSNFLSLLLSTYIRETLEVTSDYSGHLRHVMFYEEAHNLVGKDATIHSDLSTDNPNPKVASGKYMERMLEEVRAYGEGIVIADQIPVHMPDTIIKNTDLKVIFRLVAKDDIEMIGDTISASQYKKSQIVQLKPGEAIISYQDMITPQKVKVHEWKRKEDFQWPSDDVIKDYLSNMSEFWELYDINSEIIRDQAWLKLYGFSKNLFNNTIFSESGKKMAKDYIRLFNAAYSKFPDGSEGETIEVIELVCDFVEILCKFDWSENHFSDDIKMFVSELIRPMISIWQNIAYAQATTQLLTELSKKEKWTQRVVRIQKRIDNCTDYLGIASIYVSYWALEDFIRENISDDSLIENLTFTYNEIDKNICEPSNMNPLLVFHNGKLFVKCLLMALETQDIESDIAKQVSNNLDVKCLLNSFKAFVEKNSNFIGVGDLKNEIVDMLKYC